jgi:hypothetical protein
MGVSRFHKVTPNEALKKTVAKYFRNSVISIPKTHLRKIRKKHRVGTMSIHHAANSVILGIFPPTG